MEQTDQFIEDLRSLGVVVHDLRGEVRRLRDSWGNPASRGRTRQDTKYLVLHETVGNPRGNAIDSVVVAHLKYENWSNPGYFGCTQHNGDVEIIADIEDETIHVGPGNHLSMGWAMHGNFKMGGIQPGIAQYRHTVLAFALLRRIYPEAFLRGHNEMPGYDWKDCPGIDMNIFREAVHKSVLGNSTKPEPPEGIHTQLEFWRDYAHHLEQDGTSVRLKVLQSFKEHAEGLPKS